MEWLFLQGFIQCPCLSMGCVWQCWHLQLRHSGFSWREKSHGSLWLFLKTQIPQQHFLPALQVWGSVAVSTVQSAQGAGGGKLQLQQQEFRNSLGRTGSQCRKKQPLLVHWVGWEAPPCSSSSCVLFPPWGFVGWWDGHRDLSCPHAGHSCGRDLPEQPSIVYPSSFRNFIAVVCPQPDFQGCQYEAKRVAWFELKFFFITDVPHCQGQWGQVYALLSGSQSPWFISSLLLYGTQTAALLFATF